MENGYWDVTMKVALKDETRTEGRFRKFNQGT